MNYKDKIIKLFDPKSKIEFSINKIEELGNKILILRNRKKLTSFEKNILSNNRFSLGAKLAYFKVCHLN